ncbi:MAG: hypothetical protein NC397_10485, partial [Clostridium sp.]|nr:hypothetical protein [Clostridium sp.]
YYSRTERLKESFKKSEIIQNGNSYECKIGWDNDYLSFRYSGGFVPKGGSGEYNGITGLQVLQAFNDSSHGYTVSGSHNYWDEILEELGGKFGIINLFKNNLRQCGVPVK